MLLRDHGLLESATFRPQSSAFGQDAYPDLATKAAALLHSLILNHPFVDGNKRTGWLSMAVFAMANGYVLEAEEDDAYEFVLSVAKGELGVEAIAVQIKTWLRPA